MAKMSSKDVKRKRFLMLALYCMLLEKQCRRKQRSCWQKRRYADDQRFVSNHTQLQHPCCWFGKCTLKILVNFK